MLKATGQKVVDSLSLTILGAEVLHRRFFGAKFVGRLVVQLAHFWLKKGAKTLGVRRINFFKFFEIWGKIFPWGSGVFKFLIKFY